MSSEPWAKLVECADDAGTFDSETAAIEFKSTFDPADKGEFLEVLKDIVAMANSNGGTIIFGLLNDGSPSGCDLKPIASLDPAKITDAIYKYTDCQFHGFRIGRMPKADQVLWTIRVSDADGPLVFSQTGNYSDSAGKQKNAFLGGTMYFRHGAKSEPGNSEDVRLFIERRLESIRREWLEGITRIAEAPAGSIVQVLPPGAAEKPDRLVRFTADPSAPSVPVGSIDAGWPHRQKEVVVEVNKALDGLKKINNNHILYIRRAFDIEINGEFCYTQNHASPQYSDRFVAWIIQQFKADSEFFEKAKLTADQRKSSGLKT